MLIIFSRLCVSWQSCVNVLRIMYQQVGGETVALMCFTNHFATGTTHNEWKNVWVCHMLAWKRLLLCLLPEGIPLHVGLLLGALWLFFFFSFLIFPFYTIN